MNKVVFLLAIIILTSCEYHNTVDCHQKIAFANSTNNHLYISPDYGYPDTMAYKYNRNPLVDPSYSKVHANGNNRTALSERTCYENRNIPSDTLMIYVFDGETLENTPWDTIKKYDMYLYRYDLSYQDLKDRNWYVRYNGEKR